jgi:small subunit ribosomal protein S17
MSTEVDNSPQARNRRESRVGTVVSDKGDKTITVRFDYIVKHPKYGKYYKRSTKLRTHDEGNKAKNGDIVEVMSCRKISKSKCWRLTKVVRALS